MCHVTRYAYSAAVDDIDEDFCERLVLTASQGQTVRSLCLLVSK